MRHHRPEILNCLGQPKGRSRADILPFMLTAYLYKQARKSCVVVLPSLMAALGSAHASTDGLFGGSSKGFTGASIYTATGYQNATVKGKNLRVQGTDIVLPSRSETTDSSFWLVGLDYTHVFDNQFSLGAQVDYYPISTQVAVSVSPGYAFNDTVMGYVRLGWASVPTTVEPGLGRPSQETRLNAYFVGLGTKVNLYRGVFAFAELRYAEVERLDFTGVAEVSVVPGQVMSVPIQGSADTSAVNAFIGLGYRF